MYNYIINPKSNRKISIYNKLGRNILLNYLNISNGGVTKNKIIIVKLTKEYKNKIINLNKKAFDMKTRDAVSLVNDILNNKPYIKGFKESQGYVLLVNNEPIGSFFLDKKDNVNVIFNVAVFGRHQGKGFSSIMNNYVAKKFVKGKIVIAEIDINQKKDKIERLISSYGKRGFILHFIGKDENLVRSSRLKPNPAKLRNGRLVKEKNYL